MVVRPLARRPARIARPARVRIRNRKPCVFARRRLLGWKVRFMVRLLDCRLGNAGNSLSLGRNPTTGQTKRRGSQVSHSHLFAGPPLAKLGDCSTHCSTTVDKHVESLRCEWKGAR
jgi:hypothetical protein